jgi:hypothetical protein
MTRSRETMIFDLTRFELVWLQDEGWALYDVAEFFARGGFSVWSDDDLAEKWEKHFGEEPGDSLSCRVFDLVEGIRAERSI